MTGVQDALVAQGHEVIDHEARAALVVVHDGVVLGGAAVPCDHQGGQSRSQFLQPRGGHRRRDDDEPVHLPVGEGFDAFLLALGERPPATKISWYGLGPSSSAIPSAISVWKGAENSVSITPMV